MTLNEERVKLFATILRLLTNPEILKLLADKGEVIDYEGLVRAIAEMCPYPQMAAIDKAAPVIFPMPTAPFPTVPNWTPYRPLIGDPPGWNPNMPTVICANDTNAMTQADGMGDDSGTRGD